MLYTISFAYSSSSEIYIILPDFLEFSETESFCGEGYKNYFCIIQEASKYEDILGELDYTSGIIHKYNLPLDTVILTVFGVKFLDKTPKLISILQNNQKLRRIREEVVWRKYELRGGQETLLVYKLAWIEGTHDVTIYSNDSIIYWRNYLSIVETSYSFMDKYKCEASCGSRAKEIWEEKIRKVL